MRRRFTAECLVIAALVLAASALALFSSAFDTILPYVNIVLLAAAAVVHVRILGRIDKQYEAREELAEIGDRAHRAIVSNMTHEFRTPLNSVIGFAELLADGETDPERAEMARCVQQSGWELMNLVNSLVKSAESANGDGPAREPVNFRLRELTAEVAGAHEQEIRAKGLRLSVSSEGVRTLSGDRESISSILGMLISNAVKYSEAGTIELRARELNVSDAETASVEFVVADQGRGIDERTLGRLFNPFDQGEMPLIKRFPGAGIGLYSAKKRTEALRGDLRIESEKGRGTTAYLIIPLKTSIERRERQHG